MEVVNDFDKNDWSRSVESLIKTVSNKNGSSEINDSELDNSSRSSA